jgi:kynurenine formamidase
MPWVVYSRVVHLSHPISARMPCWPGDPPTEIAAVAQRATHGYFLRRIAIGEHSGTHANAPAAFHDGAETIDAYPAAALIHPAVVIDCRAAAGRDPDYLAGVDDLAAWERAHGPLPRGALVLVHTGWGARWNDARAFFNRDATGCAHFPGFSPALLERLLVVHAAAGIGIDTHGVDGGRDDRFAINTRVLDQRRIVLENLANLDQLPPRGTTVVIGALRLMGGSGTPAAVLGLIP